MNAAKFKLGDVTENTAVDTKKEMSRFLNSGTTKSESPLCCEKNRKTKLVGYQGWWDIKAGGVSRNELKTFLAFSRRLPSTCVFAWPCQFNQGWWGITKRNENSVCYLQSRVDSIDCVCASAVYDLQHGVGVSASVSCSEKEVARSGGCYGKQDTATSFWATSG